MHWQNLIYLKCPKCSSHLQEFEGYLKGYWCKIKDCGFTISHRKLVQIFLDEKHVLRSYLTAEQRIHLDEAIAKILPMKGRSM